MPYSRSRKENTVQNKPMIMRAASSSGWERHQLSADQALQGKKDTAGHHGVKHRGKAIQHSKAASLVGNHIKRVGYAGKQSQGDSRIIGPSAESIISTSPTAKKATATA